MLIHASIPVLFAIVGLLAYALSTNPKVQEIGRIAYAAGLLVALFFVAQEGISLP